MDDVSAGLRIERTDGVMILTITRERVRNALGVEFVDGLTRAVEDADGCYNERIGLATRSELIWGDYFLFESLLHLAGSVDGLRI